MRRMKRAGMLDLENGCGVDPRVSAGAFNLAKTDGKFRLICDRRVRNAMQKMLGKARLPRASRLARSFLPKTHRVLISTRDLKDYYFLCDAKARAHLQAWGPRVPMSWFDNMDAEHDYDEVEEDAMLPLTD